MDMNMIIHSENKKKHKQINTIAYIWIWQLKQVLETHKTWNDVAFLQTRKQQKHKCKEKINEAECHQIGHIKVSKKVKLQI